MTHDGSETRAILLVWIAVQPLLVLIFHCQITPSLARLTWAWLLTSVVLFSVLHLLMTLLALYAADIDLQLDGFAKFASAFTIGVLLILLFPGSTLCRVLLPAVVFSSIVFWNVVHAEAV